jgi:hypothetical protein
MIFSLWLRASRRKSARLTRLLVEQRDADEAAMYAAAPPRPEEFFTDEEPLAWEAEGWEDQD